MIVKVNNKKCRVIKFKIIQQLIMGYKICKLKKDRVVKAYLMVQAIIVVIVVTSKPNSAKRVFNMRIIVERPVSIIVKLSAITNLRACLTVKNRIHRIYQTIHQIKSQGLAQQILSILKRIRKKLKNAVLRNIECPRKGI
jgi:hypothetical protein